MRELSVGDKSKQHTKGTPLNWTMKSGQVVKQDHLMQFKCKFRSCECNPQFHHKQGLSFTSCYRKVDVENVHKGQVEASMLYNHRFA